MREVPSEEHPVVADSKRIHIGFVAVFKVVEHLGGHVEGRTQHGLGQILAAHHFAEAEIGDFGDSIVPEDIGQFQIPVEDLIFVEVVETVDALAENLNGLLLGEEPSFLDVGIEITFVAKLEDEVVVIAGFLHIVQFDDVVAFAALEDFDLALEELFEFAWMG